jgi:hypothetical protein
VESPSHASNKRSPRQYEQGEIVNQREEIMPIELEVTFDTKKIVENPLQSKPKSLPKPISSPIKSTSAKDPIFDELFDNTDPKTKPK